MISRSTAVLVRLQFSMTYQHMWPESYLQYRQPRCERRLLAKQKDEMRFQGNTNIQDLFRGHRARSTAGVGEPCAVTG